MLQLPVQPISAVFVIGYVLAGCVAVWFTHYAYRHRWNQPTTRAFGVMSILLALWAFARVGRMLTPDLAAKLLWTQIAWIGVTFVPVSLLVFAIYYTGHGQFLTRQRISLLATIPVVSQMLLLTNDSHGLVFESVDLATVDGLSFLAVEPGRYFVTIHLPYMWLLVIIAVVLLIQHAMVTATLYRVQSGALIAGMTLPLAVQVAYFGGIHLHPYLDPTPVAFGIGLAGISVAVFRIDFLDLQPVAREQLVNELSECVLVFDEEHRLIDLNEAAEEFLDQTRRHRWQLGESVENILPEGMSTVVETGQPSEVAVTIGDEERWYVVRQSQLDQPPNGRHAIALIDISEQKQREDDVNDRSERLATERDRTEMIRELLVTSPSDDEMAQEICRQLVEEHGYEAAWVIRGNDDEFASRSAQLLATHGTLSTPVSSTSGLDSLSRNAVENGEMVHGEPLDNRDTNNTNESGDAVACTAIPLRYRETTLGSLTMCTTQSNGDTCSFDSVVQDYADALAYRLFLSQQSMASTEDCRYSVTVSIPEGHVLSDICSASIGRPCTLTAHELRSDDGSTRYLVETEDIHATAFLDAAENIGVIESTSVLSETSARTTLCLIVSPPTIGGIISEHDGQIKSITADSDQVTVIAHFSIETDLERLIDTFEKEWNGTQIHTNIIRSTGHEASTLLAELTPKQEAALRAAVATGFFDRPQRATAAEIAEMLDVSRTTFLRHLREAERQVFGRAFSGKDREA